MPHGTPSSSILQVIEILALTQSSVWLEAKLVLVDLIESLVRLVGIDLLNDCPLRRSTVWTSSSSILEPSRRRSLSIVHGVEGIYHSICSSVSLRHEFLLVRIRPELVLLKYVTANIFLALWGNRLATLSKWGLVDDDRLILVLLCSIEVCHTSHRVLRFDHSSDLS